MVGWCLMDRPRSEAFEKAICAAVAPGTHVLDVGTGSGLLALFAARAGAATVTALEFDPFIAQVARQNIEANGYQECIRVVEADARSHRFEQNRFDLVLMEMLTTGCIDEFQVQAVNNLHEQGIIREQTRLIPERQETFAALAYTDFELYGLTMPMVRHLWPFLSSETPTFLRSEKQLLNSLAFNRPLLEEFEGIVTFEMAEFCTVNSLHLSSRTILSEDIALEDTPALNAPVVVALPQREFSRGQRAAIHIAYRFGGGFSQFEAAWIDSERKTNLE